MIKFKSFKNTVSRILATAMITSVMAPVATNVFATEYGTTSNMEVVNNMVESKSESLDRRLIGYFADWAYKAEARGYFDVADLQWDYLTNIQYSFGQVNQETNKVEFIDKFAAVEEDFANHPMEHKGETITIDESLPYKGHMNIINQMKKKYPDVQVTLSVGGWAGSRGFYTMMDTDAGIDTFVQSCVELVREYGLDGIDIDFEYPSSTSQSGNPDDFDLAEPRRGTINARYNIMMKKLNEALDKAAEEDGNQYILSAAVAASSWVLGGVESNDYANELDFLSIMSYDYHGGWNQFVGNQANIYPDPDDKETAGLIMPVLGADWAVKYYRGTLPSEKIIMGVPYYTRGWENVQPGPTGTGLNGTSNTPATGKYNTLGDLDANGDQIPAGVNNLWHAMNLVDQDENLKVYWDEVGKVPYLWNNNEKVFLTFENEQSIDERLKYIDENNLGGALIWTMDGDYAENPNYVEGSTDINEGKYTFGDTLTKRFSNGLEAMGPNEKSPEDNIGLEPIAVEIEQTGSYDHPNYTYDFKVTNYTDEEIKGGWEISFDLPKSAKFKSAWGGTVTEVDNGDFNRITIKSSGWQNLQPGGSTNLQGMIGLCFSGVRNVTFNGMNPVGKDMPEIPEGNQAPVLNGVANKTIKFGENFDIMAGVTATDKEDGDLTSDIKVTGTVDTKKAGKYELVYSVTDSEGLETTKTRVITVEENAAPVLNGVTDKTIKVGDSFDKMAGVTATDKEDGDLTSAIKVFGTLDTNKAGKYTLTYKVSDSQGLETTKTRVVTVEEKTVTPEPEVNEAPVLNGVINKTINVGESFDKMAGITAIDKEDGDLTSSIVVTGTVDTNKAGVYTLTYSVTDSKGLTTTATRTVTVKAVAGEGDTYDPTAIYYGGEIVVYKGEEYQAKWWTQGGTPDQSQAWEKIVKPNEDGSISWYEGMVCVGGDQVVYNGKVYEAKWWTQSTPGSDDSWKLIG